jgi:sugar/nucleoside kinase (ribokinase family)
MGIDTILVTKVGEDFPKDLHHFMNERGLTVNKLEKNHPTTRFYLKYHNDSRQLFLTAKCSPLTTDDIKDIDVDGWIVSPIIDEVPFSVLKEITKKNRFVTLDPQGYIRKVDSLGRVSENKKIKLDLVGISAIKADEQEFDALIDGLLYQPQFKIKTTRNRTIRMNEYEINLDHYRASVDATGLGDILTAAFTCAYLKEGDPKWALCYGAGAIQAALETRSVGLNKIPTNSQIEKNAICLSNKL